MQTRRAFLGTVAGAAALRGASRTKPNFLFLIADDHAGYVLGSDGNRRAQTPNLDRLASEGARFAGHFCNSPVCTPSRQSFLTGQMPHAAGVTRLPTPLAEDKSTLARQLRQAGYLTAVFGKMHFNRRAHSGIHGFDQAVTERELNEAWNSGTEPRPLPSNIKAKPPWRPFKDPARIWLNADHLPFPRHDADMKNSFMARLACRFMEEHRDQPFALWVSFTEPHSPFDFPVEDRAAYSAADFTPPRAGPEDAAHIPFVFRSLTHQDKQGIIAAYYTSVRFLDRNIGRVLAKLAELKLEETTLVVYTADHGYNLGHHGRFEKHCGFDQALRVPLIVRFPGRAPRATVVPALTEHVDLAPTVLDLLGVDPLPVQHGQSLRAHLEGKSAPGRKYIFSEYLENEETFIRTERHKFIFCSGKRERQDGYKTDNPTPGRYARLYDLKQDPGEFADISGRRPEVVDEMKQLMLGRFRATHPEAAQEPKRLATDEALEWYVRPRDA